MVSRKHYHIYTESAYDDFIKKLDIFHEKQCIGMGMWGYGTFGQELEDIHIHVNERIFDKKFADTLVDIFLAIDCDSRVQYQAESECSIDMLYYDLESSKYLVQVVRNFPTKRRYTFEVFKVEDDLKLSTFNIFWDI